MFEKGCRKARREGGRKYPVIPQILLANSEGREKADVL
jgi:hypothetical protein